MILLNLLSLVLVAPNGKAVMIIHLIMILLKMMIVFLGCLSDALSSLWPLRSPLS